MSAEKRQRVSIKILQGNADGSLFQGPFGKASTGDVGSSQSARRPRPTQASTFWLKTPLMATTRSTTSSTLNLACFMMTTAISVVQHCRDQGSSEIKAATGGSMETATGRTQLSLGLFAVWTTCTHVRVSASGHFLCSGGECQLCPFTAMTAR